MSLRMRSIYPYRVWVARPQPDRSMGMDDADHEHHHHGHSGCGCAAKAAAPPQPAASSCCGGHGDHAGHAHDHGGATTKVLAPVCGMAVDPATSKHRFEHHGETF